MDNLLKKSIQEGVEKHNKEKGEGSKSEGILPINTSPTKLKEKIKSKAPQTERRLSNVLEKIRSKSCIRGSEKTSHEKMKKLQVKYERFELISKAYKFVQQKDRGDTIVFKDIHTKAEKPFFDSENCNYFVEELHEFITSINDITGKQLKSRNS